MVRASSEIPRLAIADSTCAAMKEAGSIFSRQRKTDLHYVCKSSGLLAKGIKAGVIKADYFVSANEKWMDELVANGLIDRADVRTPWENGLTVATPRETVLDLRSIHELGSDEVGRIIIGDPGTAPFGRYAKQFLKKAGLWNRVKRKVTTRKRISLAVGDLIRAEPDTAGIIFRTNLNELLREQISIPERFYSSCRYYTAPLKDSSENREVVAFIEFLESDAARNVFRSKGFKMVR